MSLSPATRPRVFCSSRTHWALVGAGLGVLLLAQPVLAQETQRVAIILTVSHVSAQPGPIDPAGIQLHRSLQRDFKVKSVRVIQTQRMNLRLNEEGSLQLPTGRWVKVRPRKLGETGVLMAVEVEGTLRSSLRVPNHHQVVIGAQSFQDGKLVVSLEPDY